MKICIFFYNKVKIVQHFMNLGPRTYKQNCGKPKPHCCLWNLIIATNRIQSYSCSNEISNAMNCIWTAIQMWT